MAGARLRGSLGREEGRREFSVRGQREADIVGLALDGPAVQPDSRSSAATIAASEKTRTLLASMKCEVTVAAEETSPCS